ncbi:uncharacterized protein LOC134446532 [Engraulis encrasicolus]|uniref:uncharacterized protein LOC134446532 n=1 Tax=Engraulis encrasicolus TaxID=184585 RepID=UPI002FD5EE7E
MNPAATKIGNITRLTVGERNVNHTNRTILFVGETGGGKSTLVNTLVNYAMGVTWEDEVWFKIVKEEQKKQSESQTLDIIVYELFGFEGQVLPFSLTLIDTPGYGATQGTREDDIVTARLYDLFQSPDGVEEIAAVALVVQASTNRLSDRLRYIFNSVMSLFGKDMEKNIILLISNSDGMTPTNVFTALKEANVKFAKNEKNQPINFLFNNCQDKHRTEEDEDALEFAFKISRKGMTGFKNFLKTNKPQNVEESRKVLRERSRLTACIQNLQARIDCIALKQTEIKQTRESVKKCDKGMQEFVFVLDEVYKEEEPIGSGWWVLGLFNDGATRCTHCKENCHYPGCIFAPSAGKCEVMKRGRCTSYTNKCPVSCHVKDKKMYVTKTRRVKMTVKEVEEKYGLHIEEHKTSKERNLSLLEYLEKQLRDLKHNMSQLLDEAFHHVVRLDEIALITNSLSTHVHLDGLIKVMKEEGEEDKAKRLEEVQKQLDKGLLGAMNYMRKS